MRQATRHGQLTFSEQVERALREAGLWAILAVSAYLAISLVSYSPQDPGWSYIGTAAEVSNAGGRTGAWFADVVLYLFGYPAYLLPFMLAWTAWVLLRGWGPEPLAAKAWLLAWRWLGFILTLIAGCGLISANLTPSLDGLPNGPGGGLGLLVIGRMRDSFGSIGADLILAVTLFVSLSLFLELSWLRLIEAIGELVLTGIDWIKVLLNRMLAHSESRSKPQRRRPLKALPRDLALIDPAEIQWSQARPERRPGQRVPTELPERLLASLLSEPAMPRETPSAEEETRLDSSILAETARPSSQVAKTADETSRVRPEPPRPPASAMAPSPALEKPAPCPPAEKYGLLGRRTQVGRPTDVRSDSKILPPLTLLDAPRKSGHGYSEEQIEALSRQVERNLADFGVEVQVVGVYPGPVVTLFELQLAPGIKASKITGLARDLARALTVVSVRVVEIIPGKSVIGIEIPNRERETVYLREILDSPSYQDAGSPLTIALGSNISGIPVVADLARMPHALIAGTTGSGKSVAINAMILSLLYKSGPEDVRLIMIDPKMLELSVYEGIPHLLAPVVTDMKEAANALRWCVSEMERRYRLMAKLGVRNIAGYNRQIAEAEAAGTPIPDPLLKPEEIPDGQVPALKHLPYIVVIIDELADMMMVVGKKVEELIARLAQKARASGIHLLLATQRPSVDVLTGLIKANIPTRIAFQVSSRIDSRTILDQMGAEQLLGYGDMLYLPPGGNIPHRVHGAFVDDHEVHRVVEFLKTHYGEPDYIYDVLSEPAEPIPGIDPEPRVGDTEEIDPLFDEAVQIVVESRRASISGVQRRLKIGYNRAARMIEEMERLGIVGPAETNGNREVLVPPPTQG